MIPTFCGFCENFKKLEKISKKVLTLFFRFGIMYVSGGRHHDGKVYKNMNINETIFKNCDKLTKEYLNNKKQFGEYHEFTTCAHAAFCAVYQIIEDCNLEQEYQMWKANAAG